MSLFGDTAWRDADRLDQENLNRRAKAVADAIEALRAFVPAWEAEVEALRTLGLARINEALLPAFEQIRELASLGSLLSTTSESLVEIGLGTKTFLIAEGVRDSFAPTPFLFAASGGDFGRSMTGLLTSYTPATGLLVMSVIRSDGTGTHGDWRIGPIAMTQDLEDLRVEVEAAAAAAAASAGQAGALRTETQGFRNEAQGFRNGAQGFRDEALGFRNGANTARDQAQGFRNEAQGFRDQAEAAAAATPRAEDILIVNGAMQRWQRADSQTTDGYGSADRWRNAAIGGTVTMSRQAFALGDTLGGTNGAFFLRQTVSGQSAASHVAAIQQRIEGVRSYAGQTITVLFWARRSSGTGNMAVELAQVFGTGGSPSATVEGIGVTTVALTTAWQAYAVQIAVPGIGGRVLGTNGDDHLALTFFSSAGANFNGRTNSLGLRAIGVDLWGVHVRQGAHPVSAANAYRIPPLVDEFLRCQRYYQTFEYRARFDAPVAGSADGRQLPFPVFMRATPVPGWNASVLTNVLSFTVGATPRSFRPEVIANAAGAVDWQGTLTFNAEL